MRITKKYNIESAHIVRNCSSKRCSHAFHGHSYEIEISLRSDFLDNAMMVYDFGLFKQSIGKFIDSFDHTLVLWDHESPEILDFFRTHGERLIITPFNPSAEMLSVAIFQGVQYILYHTKFLNNEDTPILESVTVHETKTGSATCVYTDLINIMHSIPDMPENLFNAMEYSKGILKDWPDELIKLYGDSNYIIQPDLIPDAQITFPIMNNTDNIMTKFSDMDTTFSIK